MGNTVGKPAAMKTGNTITCHRAAPSRQQALCQKLGIGSLVVRTTTGTGDGGSSIILLLIIW